MSVIMLDDKIYDNVAASLVHYLTAGKLWCYPYGGKAKDMAIEDFEELIRKEVSEWRIQNAISYDERYKREPEIIEPMVYREVWAASQVQLYKWLQSIEYQIETNYTSLLMAKAEKELARNIISEMPEYDKAQWAF
jgi:hypothetical protein